MTLLKKSPQLLLGLTGILTAATALAALPAEELASSPDPTAVRHSGHDVATSGGFTIASSEFENSFSLPEGNLSYSGRLRLFQDKTHIRNYPLPILCTGDHAGAGRKNTIAIGSAGIVAGYPDSDCEGAPNAGAVLVFNKDGGDYEEEYSILAPPSAHDNAKYGASVATHGDWLAIGVPGLSSADMWKRQGDDWVRVGWLPTPPGMSSGSDFGKDIAMHGEHLVVGAPSEQKFYVYRNTHNGWEFRTESDDSIRTGNQVDISNNTLVSSSGASQGDTVLVYGLHWDGSWIPQQEIKHGQFPGMPFGSDVAISDHRLIIGNDIEQRVAIYGLQGGFVHLGDMQVNLPTAAGVYEFLSLGSSVDVDGDDVVGGDHDARYLNSTTSRGAVMHQKFYHVY